MLRKFDKVATQFDGTPWKDEKGKDLTVAVLAVNALGGTFDDERGLSQQEKCKRTLLAERIYSTGATPTEIEADELALIKTLVAKSYPTFIVGFVCQYLESEGSSPRAAAAD